VAVGTETGLHDEEREINMGIGIVVPVQRMMDLIKRPELDEMKERRRQEIIAEESGQAVADSSSVRVDAGSEPAMESREEFEQALRKVSRRKKPSPPEQ
jgi:hypothetical protein